MKIIDYTIVQSTKNTTLAQAVREAMESGWQPYGYPYLDKNGNEKQAVVRYEAPPVAIGTVVPQTKKATTTQNKIGGVKK